MSKQRQLFVISLGGSLIVPSKIDVGYLKKFKELILGQTKKGRRFIISPGGGKTCRRYQKALENVINASNKDLDWIGLFTNKFHAKFLQLMFGKFAHPTVADNPNRKIIFKEKILIGAGGWKPERSSDDFATRLAKVYGAETIINLSNINYLYTKDPKRHKTAKKIANASWDEFLKIIGKKWQPGSNLPFDPTAAKFAKKHSLKVFLTNGRDLKNLANIIEGKNFRGTIIA